MHSESEKTNHSVKHFTQRLDFYWQFLSVYVIALVIYAVFRGTIAEGTFSIVVKDPVVILLFIFTFVSAIGLLINLYKKRVIIIGRDFIIFKNRFREKKFSRNDLLRIAFSKEKLSKFSSVLRIIKISVANRRKTIKIRPSSFWDDKELIHSLVKLKKSLNL